MHYDSISSQKTIRKNKYLLRARLHELQPLESKIKKQMQNMPFQSIRKCKIVVSPLKLFRMLWSYVLAYTAPAPTPRNPQST